MRLPPLEFPAVSWGAQLLERWTVLAKKAATMETETGNNDAFERMLAVLRGMASSGRFDGLPELLRRRITARALSWLWLNDEVIGSRLLNTRLLAALLDAQQPRLTRMTLQQLAQLYFRRFDRLDEKEGVRELLERSLLQQLDLIPPSKIQTSRADPLVTLKREGHWLLGLDGPRHLAERVRQGGRELGETFMELGLHGFDVMAISAGRTFISKRCDNCLLASLIQCWTSCSSPQWPRRPSKARGVSATLRLRSSSTVPARKPAKSGRTLSSTWQGTLVSPAPR